MFFSPAMPISLSRPDLINGAATATGNTPDKLIKGGLIVAVRNGNEFDVESKDVHEFIINLN